MSNALGSAGPQGSSHLPCSWDLLQSLSVSWLSFCPLLVPAVELVSPRPKKAHWIWSCSVFVFVFGGVGYDNLFFTLAEISWHAPDPRPFKSLLMWPLMVSSHFLYSLSLTYKGPEHSWHFSPASSGLRDVITSVAFCGWPAGPGLLKLCYGREERVNLALRQHCKWIWLSVLSKFELSLILLFDKDEKDRVPRSKAACRVPETVFM